MNLPIRNGSWSGRLSRSRIYRPRLWLLSGHSWSGYQRLTGDNISFAISLKFRIHQKYPSAVTRLLTGICNCMCMASRLRAVRFLRMSGKSGNRHTMVTTVWLLSLKKSKKLVFLVFSMAFWKFSKTGCFRWKPHNYWKRSILSVHAWKLRLLICVL